jgi:hypothetical protein
MRKTTEELWSKALSISTCSESVTETFRRLVIENERECAEAVGVTASLPGTNNGYTFVAFKGSDVPVGTKLFTFAPAAQVPEVALYNELLFAVERKFPNETRHQTALRYIRSAEHSQTCVVAMLAAAPEVKHA